MSSPFHHHVPINKSKLTFKQKLVHYSLITVIQQTDLIERYCLVLFTHLHSNRAPAGQAPSTTTAHHSKVNEGKIITTSVLTTALCLIKVSQKKGRARNELTIYIIYFYLAKCRQKRCVAMVHGALILLTSLLVFNQVVDKKKAI